MQASAANFVDVGGQSNGALCTACTVFRIPGSIKTIITKKKKDTTKKG